MKFNETNQQETFSKKIYISSAIGSLFGIITAIILLMIFAAVLSFSDVEESFLSFFGYLAVVLGSFLGGIVSSIKCKKKGLILGLFTGILLFIILFIIRLIIVGFDSFTISTLVQLLLIVVASTCGGILGVNIKLKRK